jgi:hypothetical protein
VEGWNLFSILTIKIDVFVGDEMAMYSLLAVGLANWFHPSTQTAMAETNARAQFYRATEP